MGDNDLMNWIQEWLFERFMRHFGHLDNNLEKMSGRNIFLDSERLLDNQDVCKLLHISRSTLQRYHFSSELPYQTYAGLEDYLKVIFPTIGDWVHDKALDVVNGISYRNRSNYRSDKLNL